MNFTKFFKSTLFTEQFGTTTSAFSFSEAATGGVPWKKVFLKISQNTCARVSFLIKLQASTCDFVKKRDCRTGVFLWILRNFQRQLFYITPLDECLWLFPATLLIWGTPNSVWKTSDEYALSRNTNFRSTVQVYHFFLGNINFQCMFSLDFTVHCQKLPSECRCSVRKGVPKNFAKFIGKHLCWSCFLIKLQAWHLFLRTSANDCFCTALAPLAVAYSFYFIQHLLPPHQCYYCVNTVNISNVCFWFKFKRFQRI